MRKTTMILLLVMGLMVSACGSLAAAQSAPANLVQTPHTEASSTGSSQVVEGTDEQTNTIDAAITPAPGADEGLSQELVDILGNLSYSGLFPDQQITLENGIYAYSEGGVGTPHIQLIDRQIVLGDLNGDGAQDAVILLEDDSEGSGRFTFLVAVLNILTDPLPVEAVMVGDRIGVKTLTIDGTQVTLDVVAQGQGDTDCCASWNTRVVYELKDDQLLETNRTEHNRISLGDLNNTQWSLVTRAVDQKLIPSRITLQIEDNQISGFSGCNDYSASISPGEYGLNSVHLSEIATSEEVCPQPATLQEADYLNQLGSVVSWNYDYGYLSLLYATENDRLENLLFAPAGEQ